MSAESALKFMVSNTFNPLVNILINKNFEYETLKCGFALEHAT